MFFYQTNSLGNKKRIVLRVTNNKLMLANKHSFVMYRLVRLSDSATRLKSSFVYSNFVPNLICSVVKAQISSKVKNNIKLEKCSYSTQKDLDKYSKNLKLDQPKLKRKLRK